MYSEKDRTNLFVFWGTICLLANILLTFANPYGPDQNFWANWLRQLVEGGLGNLKCDYPPVYILWLWIVAQVHSIFNLEIANSFFLKFICLWPVYFSHVFFVDFASRFVLKLNHPRWQTHLILGFVALNPALLLDGPIWGQIDLFPIVFAILGIYCINYRKTNIWSSAFYVFALLTKFQMILFLPVFGGLFLKHWRRSWKSLPLGFAVIALVLLPFLISGNLLDTLRGAYVSSSDTYPFATYNAANLWMLLSGNTTPNSVPIFGGEGGLSFLLKPSVLGRILFVLVSIFVLVKSILSRNIRTVWMLATINAVAFFVVLPGMHERYLIYAVPAALCWFLWEFGVGGIACFFVSAVAAVNVNMINSLKGYDLWGILSFFACLTLLATIAQAAAPKKVKALVNLIASVKYPRFIPYAMLSVIIVAMAIFFTVKMSPVVLHLNDNEILVADLHLVRQRQDYGSMHYDKTVDGNALSAAKKTYQTGIGTHANSSFEYELPDNADSLFIGAAVDDEAGGAGSVKFIVKADGHEIWRSDVIKGGEDPQFVSLPIRGCRRLQLITDADGSNHSDHADWLNPYIKLF
ncbi:MAG: NPCBM/NEW2 domain-containing protein [Fibrobacter sp.]|nr:NPCBM/NEW2 domain-containing protein [Fibrobacter sp.]